MIILAAFLFAAIATADADISATSPLTSGFPPAISGPLASPAHISPQLAQQLQAEFAKIRQSMKNETDAREEELAFGDFPVIPAELPSPPPLFPQDLAAAALAFERFHQGKPDSLASIPESPLSTKNSEALHPEPPLAETAADPVIFPVSPASSELAPSSVSAIPESTLVADSIAFQIEQANQNVVDGQSLFGRIHQKYREMRFPAAKFTAKNF